MQDGQRVWMELGARADGGLEWFSAARDGLGRAVWLSSRRCAAAPEGGLLRGSYDGTAVELLSWI